MKILLQSLSVVWLSLGLVSTVHAHSCPLEMYKIDRQLALKPKLSPEVLAKVRSLREEGEKLHREEKHGEAMLVLGSAKRLLGIQ